VSAAAEGYRVAKMIDVMDIVPGTVLRYRGGNRTVVSVQQDKADRRRVFVVLDDEDPKKRPVLYLHLAEQRRLGS